MPLALPFQDSISDASISGEKLTNNNGSVSKEVAR